MDIGRQKNKDVADINAGDKSISRSHENDLISRQAAIDALENTKTAISENGERYIAKQNAIMRIDALPSAQPTFDARDTQYNLPIGTDCISRQAAINKILGQPPEPHYPSWYAEQIKELPSAEPQIIYCKDCKHRDNYGCCKHWKGLAMGDIPIATDDNDFCSNAER